MHAKLTQIRATIALAQEQVADLRKLCPDEILKLPELAEIDASLFLTMGRADALRVLVNVYRASHPDK